MILFKPLLLQFLLSCPHWKKQSPGGVLLTPCTRRRGTHPFSRSSYKSIILVPSSLLFSVVVGWPRPVRAAPPGSQCPALCNPTPGYYPFLVSKPGQGQGQEINGPYPLPLTKSDSCHAESVFKAHSSRCR